MKTTFDRRRVVDLRFSCCGCCLYFEALSIHEDLTVFIVINEFQEQKPSRYELKD